MAIFSPLISVIIPVYNAESFIEEALQSICNQSYKNLEIIIIDDGSTDKSREIIEKFEDNRVLLISRENRGLIATLNEAIEMSRGDYIARMDADDICVYNRLEKQLKYLQMNHDTGLAFTGIEYIDVNGTRLRVKASSKARILQPVELLFGCPVCHPTAMFDMTKLNKSDIKYSEQYALAEDFELWTRLVETSNIGLLNEVLFKYRVHENSITSKNSEKQRKVASKAIVNNLTRKNKISDKHLFTIYNNHLGDETKFETFIALTYVALKLKKLNKIFSYKKFISKSYYLFRDKLKKRENKMPRV